MIAIASIGLTRSEAAPTALRWQLPVRSACGVGWFAHGIDPQLRGAARWQALAEVALAECGARGPLVVGSCNGGVAELTAASWASAFELGRGAIASAACASGLHALWLARRMIEDDGLDEVTVLAVDTLSPAGHANFETLRVLAPDPAPWQPYATGFLPGEAAVALRIVRARPGDGLPRVIGPLLAHDLDDHDALATLAPLATPRNVARILGQGTGPALVDARELAALEHLALEIPLATPLARSGHTLGASGLLSVALAARDMTSASHAPHPRIVRATDGRRLGEARGNALVVCRALGGACAAVGLTPDDVPAPPESRAWSAPSGLVPLRIPLLRRIASEAAAHRPEEPPTSLIVHLDAPLMPPDDARIGERLLPSVVLEMTPGFVAQLIARAWGYRGPAITLVGGLPGVRGVVRVRGTEVSWELERTSRPA
jgi:hypothetical protein